MDRTDAGVEGTGQRLLEFAAAEGTHAGRVARVRNVVAILGQGRPNARLLWFLLRLLEHWEAGRQYQRSQRELAAVNECCGTVRQIRDMVAIAVEAGIVLVDGRARVAAVYTLHPDGIDALLTGGSAPQGRPMPSRADLCPPGQTPAAQGTPPMAPIPHAQCQGETPRNDTLGSSVSSSRKDLTSSSLRNVTLRCDDDDEDSWREEARGVYHRLFPAENRPALKPADRRLVCQLAVLRKDPTHGAWVEAAIQATEEAFPKKPIAYVQGCLERLAPPGVSVQQLRWSVDVPAAMLRGRPREAPEPP